MNAILRPTAPFMLSHPAHFIALGFGTGLSPVAPGTVGTLLALPLYLVLDQWLSPEAILAVIAVLFAVGVWAAGRTGRALGIQDHTSMNIDEIVAFMLVLWLTPAGLAWQMPAFFVFRFFDVVKPPPIRYFDRTVKGGFGVMFDDLLAALYTLIVVALAVRLLGS
jgi:phosphatidylglycerophosphatase A